MEDWRPTVARSADPSRRVVAAGLIAAAAAMRAEASPCAPPTVLFVCPAGSVNSAIARETLRSRAAAARVGVRVQSRGVHPEDHLSPALAARLRADGIDPAADPIRQLSPGEAGDFDVVVAFDEAAREPSLRKARVWEIPSWNTHYDEARAALATQVDSLIAELRSRPARPCETPKP